MCGSIYNPGMYDLGMVPYPPRMPLPRRTPPYQLLASGFEGFHTVRGDFAPLNHHFRARFVEL